MKNNLVCSFAFLLFCTKSAICKPFFHAGICDWSIDPSSDLCLKASTAALRVMAEKLKVPISPACTLRRFGGRAAHFLCDQKVNTSKDCVFYSFGVNTDWSFDRQLAEAWECDGILLDPSINHRAQMHPRLRFFPIGATMLNSDEQGGAGSLQSDIVASSWLMTSPVKLMQFLGHKNISVLKMDCEGCEYSIARDLFQHGDPRFFSKVGQFAFEAHVSRSWTKTVDHIHFLGLLFHILKREGFELIRSAVLPCSREDEVLGCMDELIQVGYPCGSRKMCHEYSFSRLLEAYP
jgi:hypothetical protein